MKAIQTNPVATALIWNYVDRINIDGATDPNKVEEKVIINTVSLRSMTTSKSKSSPVGSFELRLAPTFNWITRITVGSWCVLNMSPTQNISAISSDNVDGVDKYTFKMLGRIESVRVSVSVDQNTGARSTEYIVQGEDWGSVFNTKLYIDPIARNNNLEKAPAVGHAARMSLEKMVTSWAQKDQSLPTSQDVLVGLIALWGNPLALVEDSISGQTPDLILSSQAQFKIPKEVAAYMGFEDSNGDLTTNIASVIRLVGGVLKGYDNYGGDPLDAFGFADPNSLYGMHTFWQVLMDNCNSTLNELIAEIRFDSSVSSTLALYRRIKPFITRESFKNEDISHLVSRFSDVKKTTIPVGEVLNINAGTNWRDKINFVEIQSQPNLNLTTFNVAIKTDSQTKDVKAFERDGFKPLIEKVLYTPYKDGLPQPFDATKWKFLLREWYFNTHNMLNGTVTFIGRSEYIAVGDNIEIDSSVFGAAPFNDLQSTHNADNFDTFLLAHVENISHQFTVGDNGERSFFTTVQFSRGIIADFNGYPLDETGSALDGSAETLTGNAEKNTHSTFGWSGESDPDKQKLKGN